jgi:hypothetical protein
MRVLDCHDTAGITLISPFQVVKVAKALANIELGIGTRATRRWVGYSKLGCLRWVGAAARGWVGAWNTWYTQFMGGRGRMWVVRRRTSQ